MLDIGCQGPILDVDIGAVELSWNCREADGLGWRCFGDDARQIFDWISARAEQWPLWMRLAQLFGSEVLNILIVEPAREEAATVREAEARARMEEEERSRLHQTVELFCLDKKGKPPALSLESGDADKPFFIMRFDERWERDRVVDWLRWQDDRFAELRQIADAEGALALERIILQGMREGEADAKRRGLSSGGRRPLRFWRGE